MKYIFNDDQKAWVHKNLATVADALKRVGQGKKSKKNRVLANKFTPNSTIIDLGKREYEAVLSLTRFALKTLDKAIEKYRKEEEKYKEYIDRAVAKEILLLSIVDKIEDKL